MPGVSLLRLVAGLTLTLSLTLTLHAAVSLAADTPLPPALPSQPDDTASDTASQPDDTADTALAPPSHPEEFPVGSAERCRLVAKQAGSDILRLEVLPGMGWDRLRSTVEGQVVHLNYSKCLTSDDGGFLLPDSVNAIPVQNSYIKQNAELIKEFKDFHSADSQSSGFEFDVGVPMVGGVSSKYSDEYNQVKNEHSSKDAQTTQVIVKYTRYRVQLQPGTSLDPMFRRKVLNIAAAYEMKQENQARYLAELLVASFGTDFTLKVDAGASMEKRDQIKRSSNSSDESTDASTEFSAAASMTGLFESKFSYKSGSSNQKADSYDDQRTSSKIITRGGPLYQPSTFSPDWWALRVDQDLAPVGRVTEPLYRIITGFQLPELPVATLLAVRRLVKDSITSYVAYNSVQGCMKNWLPGFAPAATVEDESCHVGPTPVAFGGVFQDCHMAESDNGDLCARLTQDNPMTGQRSCSPQFHKVPLYTGNVSSIKVQPVCDSNSSCRYDTTFSVAVFRVYWCVSYNTNPPPHGYLFGGFFAPVTANLVTKEMTCPTHFFPLRLGSNMDLHICVGDRMTELHSAVPFGGFLSCQAGNPRDVYAREDDDFRRFFASRPEAWSMRCAPGYSRRLATIDQGCQIHVCIQATRKFNESLASTLIRPLPAAPAPELTDFGHLHIFDPVHKVWRRNETTQAILDTIVKKQPWEEGESSPQPALSTASVVGISVGATVGGFLLLTLVVIATLRFTGRRRKTTKRRDKARTASP